MPGDDVVNAYLRGEVSRRIFVRHLVAAGVSLSAAAAYAELLAQPAHARHIQFDPEDCSFWDYYDPGDFYDDFYRDEYEDFHEYCEGLEETPGSGTGSSGTAGSAGAAGTGGGGPQPPLDTPPLVRIRILSVSAATLALTGRLVVEIGVNEASIVDITLLLGPAAGTADASRQVALGKKRAIFRRAGKRRVTLKLSKKARRRLLKRRRPSLTLRTRARDAAGNVRVTRTRLRLRRRRRRRRR